MMTAKPERRFWSSFVLGACAVLVAGTLWLNLSAPTPALAQVPDSGAQRNAMIKELRSMNGKLGEIAGLLRDIRDDARKAQVGRTSQPAPAVRP